MNIRSFYRSIYLYFYENIQSKVGNFDGNFVVIGGDFNLVQEISLDYYNYTFIGNPKARKIVL